LNPILISPQIASDEPIEEQLRKMKSYLFRFKEEVELLLSNIDTDNLSEKFEDDFSKVVGSKIMGSKEMSQIIQSAGAIKLEVEELGGNVATLSVTTTGIYNQINNPDTGILAELSILGDSIAAAVKFGVDYTGFQMTPTSFAIKSTGTFTVDSQNFIIDSSGNVTVKGRVEASEGYIGGLGIDPNGLTWTYNGDTRTVLKGNSDDVELASKWFNSHLYGRTVWIGNQSPMYGYAPVITVDGQSLGIPLVMINGDLSCGSISDYSGHNRYSYEWKDIDTVVGTGAYVLVGTP